MLSRLASALLVVLVVGAVTAPPALARRSTPARSDARGIAANTDLIGLDIIPIDGLPSVEAQSPPTRPAVDAATLLSVPLTPLADVGTVELDATADADTGTATATAEVADVVLLEIPGVGPAVEVGLVRAHATAGCTGFEGTGTTVDRVRIFGQDLPLSGLVPANLTVPVELPLSALSALGLAEPLEVATLVLNEITPDNNGKGRTVRGLHLYTGDTLASLPLLGLDALVDADVILAEAHASSTCAPRTDAGVSGHLVVHVVRLDGGLFTIEVVNQGDEPVTLTQVVIDATDDASITGTDGDLLADLDTDADHASGDVHIVLDGGDAVSGTVAVDGGDASVLLDVSIASTDGIARSGLEDGVDGGADSDEDGLTTDEEYGAGTDPFDADTDGDGISDGDEVASGDDPTEPDHGTSPGGDDRWIDDDDDDDDGVSDADELVDGTDPYDPDTDDDGLDDGEEAAAGTDPTDADSDDDGLSDGEEVAAGTDPTDADSDDDGTLDAVEAGQATDEDPDDDGLTGPEETLAGTDPADADSDDDGLSDGEEVAAGTDPTDADSDDDGLSDGDEVEAGSDPADADSDDDGLSDGDELTVGTDPTDADSDDDGLSDGEEVAAGTDPSDADSDDDGLDDGDELAAGTDPTDSDSDDDGIPDAVDAGVADEADRDHDGRDDGQEAVAGTDPADADSDNDGLSDGDEVLAGSDPTDADSDDDGLSDGDEVVAGSDPTDADSDDDGLPDGDEVGRGTDPTDADSDDDGLEDREEIVIGSDPTDRDSDDDGLSDGDEVAAGSDPTQADSDGDGTLDAVEAGVTDDTDPDNDGLPEAEELLAGTDPADADSDDDGLDDGEEVDLGSDPTDADSDGDGLEDGEEVDLGSDPTDVDSDDDGLEDGEEVDRGSDPTDADSDGDGLSDGDEVAGGTDPTDADSDDSGTSDNAELAAGTDPTDPTDDPSERIDGDSRVETAVEVSQHGRTSAPAAVIARADEFADALTSSTLAAEVDGPILLTNPSRLDGRVLDELQRLDVETVYLAGGTAALSIDIERSLADDGYRVVRLAGPSRVETAVRIAEEVVALGGGVQQVLLARADAFPDALAAANLATWGRTPILLSGTDAVPAATLDALDRVLAPGRDTVWLAGGPSALSSGVAEQLQDIGMTTERFGGDDRYTTALLLTQAARTRFGAGIQTVWVASGTAFPDALTAGVAAWRDGNVLVLADPTDLTSSPAVGRFLDEQADVIDGAVFVGGPAGLSRLVEEQVVSTIAG